MHRTWAIIGGGNGGQAMAGHLALLGERVRLFDVFSDTVDAIGRQGGIKVTGAVNGFGPLEFATTDMGQAMEGADVVMIVLPSIYHEEVGKKCIEHLRDGQIVFLHPEASCGALAFKKLLAEAGNTADVTIGAANTLLYSTRILTPGTVDIFGVKHSLYMAALPASRGTRLEETIGSVFPNFVLCPNVLYTSISNNNAMMHPAPTLLNVARIEAGQDYLYYTEGITPSIGAFVERMDEERIALGGAYGFVMKTLRKSYLDMYNSGDMSDSDSLSALCKKVVAYREIKAQKTLRTRYIFEDVPYSLVALQSLAKVAGVSTPCIDAVVQLAHGMLRGELDEGRTCEALGIAGMTKAGLLRYVS
jgi:opine dehydrogenase